MENKRFKPRYDKCYIITWIVTVAVIAAVNVIAVFEPSTLFIFVPVDALVLYFALTQIFGYVELRDDELFIRFGLILKKEIPYDKIRGISREHKFYADSMISLKTALDHVNVKYNRFDMVSLSVVNDDELVTELEARVSDSEIQ